LKFLTRQFTYHLLSAIEDLEDKTLIEVTRRGTGQFAKILQFKLTEHGNEELSKIVFTHQERMGE
jgi:DNA-binding PadR family transcriptional regulator